MPKPKTKAELLQQSQANFVALQNLVERYSAVQQNQEFPAGTLNRNIRDVLAHLHHWHLLFLEWYRLGMIGEKPAMPAEGYSWKMMPALNQHIREHYRSVSLDEARRALQESYAQVQQIIIRHSDEELFEKKRYSWTGSTSLGTYLISNTASHYAWASKLIKRSLG